MKWILLTFLISSQVFAAIHKAPKSFNTKNTKAIFVDFISVETNVIYDLANRRALAETTINFKNQEIGSPLFDLVPEVISATLNGKIVNIASVKDPTNITEYRMVENEIQPGTHQLIITNTFNDNIDFNSNHVNSAFWMSDLSDRKYLERYIPSNMEFDQYALKLNVKITSNKKIEKHEVFSNGVLTINAENDFTIQFPEYFTTSSYYFHITKEGRFHKTTYDFKSINGNTVPVVIYSQYRWDLNKAVKSSKEVLTELEAKLGAWSHPSLTIYIAGAGGMEYSGATRTSMFALQHEIIHSYFARGVMPIDGNSGWMDEAIASWRDDGYQTARKPSFSTTRMSGQSTYKRFTDRKAYDEGANFMEYLNHKLDDQGGLIKFLAHLYKEYDHKNISTQIFKKELELWSGINFTADFNQYIFGSKVKSSHKHSHKSKINPYHIELSDKEQRDLL